MAEIYVQDKFSDSFSGNDLHAMMTMIGLTDNFSTQEKAMFHIKRAFKAKPGQSRKVATLAYQAAETYSGAGQRGEFSVYFNPGTTPGEKDIVVLQWADEALKSVFREENEIPSKSLEIWRELLTLTEENWIEFNELLTPDKMVK